MCGAELVRLDSIHEQQEEHESAAGTPRPLKAKDTITNVYNPPRPDDLHVGVELRYMDRGHSSDVAKRTVSMDGAAPVTRPAVPARPPGHGNVPNVLYTPAPAGGAGGGAFPRSFNTTLMGGHAGGSEA